MTFEDIKKEREALKRRREARVADEQLAAELEALKKERRADEEQEFEAKLRDTLDGKELGVHYDYLRFGDHLVAFAHNKGAHDIFVKKLPDKGQANPAEVSNFVHRSLLNVNGVTEPPQDRGAAFDKVAEEFPGAANAIANVLLELAKGGIAIRSGK